MSASLETHGHARRGAAFGLLAAALFGLSAPLAKRLLGDMTPQVLAGLLYLGAGLGLSAWRFLRPATAEAPVSRADMPLLAVVALCGGVIGPLLMLVGLNRVSAVAGSLLLNLEGPFTMAIAVLVFREHLGRYGIVAAGCILLGAGALRFQAGTFAADATGILCIACACLAWGLDNNLTQRLSLKDPFAIVRLKSLSAGVFNLTLGLALGGRLPAIQIVAIALLVGLFSYGASVVLDAYALRLVGAAREAAYFATAPFVGVIGAVVMLGEPLRPFDLIAMLLMALGVVALLRERHSHKLKISELDITVYSDYLTGTFDPQPEKNFTAALETTQAKRFANLFALYRKNKAIITSVTLWGISDDRTWLDNEPVVGRNDYPLLYDDAHQPKAARASVMSF